MRADVYPVRITKQTRAALEAAALGKQMKPRTLAQLLIDVGLQREGYLPKAPRSRPAAQA